MIYGNSACPDCRRLTNRDCGEHYPKYISNVPTRRPTFTDAEIEAVLRAVPLFNCLPDYPAMARAVRALVEGKG